MGRWLTHKGSCATVQFKSTRIRIVTHRAKRKHSWPIRVRQQQDGQHLSP